MTDQLINEHIDRVDQAMAEMPPRKIATLDTQFVPRRETKNSFFPTVWIYYEGWQTREENGEMAVTNNRREYLFYFNPTWDVLEWMHRKLDDAILDGDIKVKYFPRWGQAVYTLA